LIDDYENYFFNKKFVGKLKSSNNILFFTGAGISAESGIPTFRGKDGIWNKFNPSELANFNAFIKNPNLVWEWYQYRRKIINETNPNPAHYAITEFEKYYSNVSVVTQNVDNLHRRAGNTNVYELHGNIERNFCINCYSPYDENVLNSKEVPKCKNCGGLIRPDVVWFGENLPTEIFAESENKAKFCDICFVIGTSAVVFPAANIPLLAKNNGAFTVEINIEKTEFSSYADLTILGKTGEILPNILSKVKQLRKTL